MIASSAWDEMVSEKKKVKNGMELPAAMKAAFAIGQEAWIAHVRVRAYIRGLWGNGTTLARRFTIGASRELVSYERVSWDEDGVVSIQYTAHGEMEELGDIENVAKAMSDAVMARDNPIEAICLLRSVLREMRAGAVDFSVTNEIVGTIASKPPHDNPIPHRRVSSRRAARARVYRSSCRRWSVTRIARAVMR